MPISNHVHLAVSLDHSSVPQAPLVVIKVSFLIHPLVCDLNLETLTASFGSVKIKASRHSKPFECGPIPQTQVFKRSWCYNSPHFLAQLGVAPW